MIPQSEYAARRARLVKAVGENSVILVPAASQVIRTGDACYPFRQNSDFYYLTGFNEPDAVLVLLPQHSHGEYILFTRKKDPAKEIWDGKIQGLEGVVENYQVDQAYDIHEFQDILPKLLENRQRIYLPIGHDLAFDDVIFEAIAGLRAQVRRGVSAPEEFHNVSPLLHEMRLRKSAAEIEVMKQAAVISIAAHKKAMQVCQPGINEAMLEAELLYTFHRNGSRSPAYSPIVGSGKNGCILHYNENNCEIKNGDLVLIDAGAEYQNYSSDITRTFPANGKYSKAQAALYNLAIALVKPGTLWMDIQHKIIEIYTHGLVELGVLKGDVKQLIADKTVTKFYMHNSGHWLGLDTHDVGSYKSNNEWRQLEAGFVLTIEPGLYIPENTDGVDEKWWNIGIRIEDDVLVTETGCEVLTKDLPKTIDDIEALMCVN
mgnify:CR=1 FL=1